MRKINVLALHLPRWALLVLMVGCDAPELTQPATVPSGRLVPARIRGYVGYGYRPASQIWPEEDLIYASNQNDEGDDGKIFRCPDQDVVTKTWKFTVEMEPDYLAHFEFTGPKFFIRYNRTLSAAGPLPVADYRYIEQSVDQNDRYIARAPGIISIACRGTYVRVPAGRVWVGNYWTIAHEGTIELNPGYPGGGGDGCAADEAYTVEYDVYDDGSSNPTTCGDGGGGSSTEGTGDTAGDWGSGTQFSPGDLTGGETVDWQTGVGNGGQSVCGDAAIVEYTCIETYDDQSGTWKTWGCGYVTTC